LFGRREGRHDQDLQGRPVSSEGAGGLQKHAFVDEPIRGIREAGGAERLGVPAFHHDDGAINAPEVRRIQHERARARRGRGARVQHEEIDRVLLLEQ
jgi:hypothetical protein